MTGRYLVLVVILMMACISYGQQRSSKMKPPLIGEESSGQKRRTAGTLKNSNRSLRLEGKKRWATHVSITSCPLTRQETKKIDGLSTFGQLSVHHRARAGPTSLFIHQTFFSLSLWNFSFFFWRRRGYIEVWWHWGSGPEKTFKERDCLRPSWHQLPKHTFFSFSHKGSNPSILFLMSSSIAFQLNK